MEWHRHLSQLGMIRPVSGGIQVDITAGLIKKNKGMLHGTLCDHNCTSINGHYDCPAAFTLNQGIDAGSLAPADFLLQGIDRAIQAVKIANERFLNEVFGTYCKKFKVPTEVSGILAAAIRNQPIEINITGGNPELHPDIIEILTRLNKRADIVINLTTTGRKFMLDADFRHLVIENPPEVLALSADAFSSAVQVGELANKSPGELLSIWQSIPKTHGQKQKAVEALYIAVRLKNNPTPHTGFNLVVHPGNIKQIEDIITALADNFPGFHIFPYPAQTGYLNTSGTFNDSDVLESFVDRMIAAHFNDILPITPRLQYWLILKAVFRVYNGNVQAIADMIGGRGLWHCYRNSGAIRYLQIGKGASPTNNIIGGGHLGCYWNMATITNEDKQVWDMDVPQIADYIFIGANMLARESQSPCSGCGFPRLLFDVVSTETGLNELLIQDYLILRKQHAGY
ncbi:hypothetical protein ACFLZQ_03095 [Thermodesulfobacteriota bacterium]